jgi:hypothetical protein
MSRIVLGVLALATWSASAQQPDGPYWVTTPVPPGFTQVTNIGTSGTIKAAGSVTFFSAILRTFTTVTVSATAQISSFNDYCTIKDGNTVTAYCTRTGVASTLTVSPAAVLTNGPQSSSWVAVVVDGNQAWGYGAFGGAWAPLTLASSTPQVVAGNNTLLIYDGVQVHGLSSFNSYWTSFTPTEPIIGLQAGGFVGLAWGATTVWGFTNHRQQWSSHPFAAVGTPIIRDNFAVFNSLGVDFLFYSAITETFVHHATLSAAGLTTAQNVAALQDGATIYLYASPKGAFVPLPVTSATPVIYSNSEWVVVDDGGVLEAFSGVTGVLAAPLTGSFTVAGNEDVAFATGATSYAYSAIQNAWAPAPPGAPISVQYVRNGVILVQPTGGYDGFCARTGLWSPILTNTPSSFSTLSNSATFVAFDGNSMSVFDSRLGRWATQATVAQPTVSIWRFTLLAHDATNAYGFAMTNNVWETKPIGSVPIQMVANDSVGFVRTATDIHFYCSLGSLSTISRYPEFSRMQPRGSYLRFMQIGQPGSLVTAAVSTVGDYLPVPPYGIAFLSVGAGFVGFVDLPAIPASGVLDISFLLPNDPTLNDVPIYLQDVITPPSGPAYITNSMSPIVV